MKISIWYVKNIFTLALVLLCAACNTQKRRETFDQKTRKEILHMFPQVQKIVEIDHEPRHYIAIDASGTIRVFYWTSGSLMEEQTSEVK